MYYEGVCDLISKIFFIKFNIIYIFVLEIDTLRFIIINKYAHYTLFYLFKII